MAWPKASCLPHILFSKRATLFCKRHKLAELGAFDAPTSCGLYLPKKFYAQKGKNEKDIQLQDRMRFVLSLPCKYLKTQLNGEGLWGSKILFKIFSE